MENNALLILIGSIIVVTAFFIFPAFKYGPLAYGVARVRAKKSKLLSESDLQELSKESFKEIIYSLQEKGYPSLIEYVEDSYPISEIQKKLRETYMQELKQIYMYIPQKHKAFFKVLLMQQDLEIIIAILRGIIYNTDSSKNTTSKQTQNIEIGSHTISGMLFTEKDLESVDTMTLEDIKKILSNTIFESFAKQKIDTLTKDDDIQTMLYDMYYTKLQHISKSDQYLEKYANVLVDIYNIKKALTLSSKKIIHKGLLSEKINTQLESAQSIEDIKNILQETNYALPNVDYNDCITELYKQKKEFGKKLALHENIAISQFLSYFIQKHTELRNIRILLKLTNAGVHADIIERSLI